MKYIYTPSRTQQGTCKFSTKADFIKNLISSGKATQIMSESPVTTKASQVEDENKNKGTPVSLRHFKLRFKI